LLGGIAVVLAFAGLAASQEKKSTAGMTDQQKRGHEIFLHAQKTASCSTCHALAGEGTAVGPDLTNLAGVATPEGVRVAIESTQTVYVVAVKLNNGTTFPAMKGADDGTTVEFYDLSKTPPEARKVAKKDIDSVGQNSVWKHPPGSADYTADELADVISYLRFVAKGEHKAIKLQ
jgi:mono/diheme cytochrome c family protein